MTSSALQVDSAKLSTASLQKLLNAAQLASAQAAQQHSQDLASHVSASQEQHAEATAAHARELQQQQQAASSSEAKLQEQTVQLQATEQRLRRQAAQMQQDLADQQAAHRLAIAEYETRLSEALATQAAMQQAAGVQAALAASNRQLSSLSEAVQRRMSEHHELVEQAARSLPGSLQAQLSLAPGDRGGQTDFTCLLGQLAGRDKELQSLQAELEELQQAFSGLVGL